MPVSTHEQLPETKNGPKGTRMGVVPSTVGFPAGLGVLAALVCASVVLAAGVGAVHVPAKEIVSMLLNHMGFLNLPRTWPLSDEI